MKKIDKKRRIQSRTNYTKRLIMLKGKSPRLVIRKSNRYILLQIVESKAAQDKVLCSASSRELLALGWPKENVGGLKSVSAGYLAGRLLASKAKSIKERVILDSGLIPNTKGSRIYAALKGAKEGGLNVPADEEVFPDDEKIEKGSKLDSKIFNKIKGGIK